MSVVGCGEQEPKDSGEDTHQDTDTDEEVYHDYDADGHTSETDCDDYDPAIFPGADEVWDFEDNDCDGRVDANGRYGGTAVIRYEVVYEGQRRVWDLGCSGTLERSTNQIKMDVVCETTDLNNALALQVLGAEVRVSEVDNVASENTWGGEVSVVSSAGWQTDGDGSLVWVSFKRAKGSVSAVAQNLKVTGEWTFDLE